MSTLFEKRGRRYVPVIERWHEDDADRMSVGTFRLTYCYSEGGRRFQYDVTPATASWVAAAMIARDAMVAAMQEAAASKPAVPMKYSKKQLEIIARYRKEMADAGGNLPQWWSIPSAFDIADAAIKALTNWKP